MTPQEDPREDSSTLPTSTPLQTTSQSATNVENDSSLMQKELASAQLKQSTQRLSEDDFHTFSTTQEETVQEPPFDELGQSLQSGVGAQETQTLISGVIHFLAQHKNDSSFGDECQTIIRSLEFNPTSSTLARALLLAKHIIQSWDS
jgi:hypothetical protein